MAWRNRWSAHRTTINQLDVEFGSMSSASPYGRRSTIQGLLRALAEFADHLVGFFDDGFAGTGSYHLEPSKDEPPDYVFGLINAQIDYDLDVILRAFRQRQVLAVNSPSQREAMKRATLERADRLAYQALLPAIQAGIVEPATVLTYFEKSLRVRLIPYAPVALIGIPYSAVNHPLDFAAIAHEVGHYVYRHRALTQWRTRRLTSRSALPIPDPFTAWHQEIFADVYGCLMAGPAIALSFQDLSMQMRADNFAADDQTHPTPALRPYIYIDAMRRLSEAWGIDLDPVIGLLSRAWDHRLQARYVSRVQLPGTATSGEPHEEELETARARVDEDVIRLLVDRDLSQMVEILRPGPSSTGMEIRPWFSVADWNHLLTVTEDQLALVPEDRIQWHEWEAGLPELALDRQRNTLRLDPGGTPFPSEPVPLGATQSILQDRIPPNPSEPTPPIPWQEWREYLRFCDWIELGPGGGRAH